MSETLLETYHKISQLYKNPYCICELYEKNDKRYRIFCIADETIKTKLVILCLESDITFSFYKQYICLIEEFYEAKSLQEWSNETHTIQERIYVCRNLIFELMNRHLHPSLQDIVVDSYNIGITTQQEIVLFQNPHFSHLKHTHTSISIPQCCAVIICQILADAKERKYHFRYESPQIYTSFCLKVKQKEYHSFPAVMRDLNHMEQAFIKKKIDLHKTMHMLVYCLLLILFLIVLGIGISKYMEWDARTYDGLQRIGGESI